MKKIIYFLLSFILLGNTLSWASTDQILSASTQQLVNLNTSATKGVNADKAITKDLIKTMKERRNLLIQGLMRHPGEYVKYLLTQKQLSALPATLKPFVESEVSNIEGTLEIISTFYIDPKSESLHYVIHAANGTDYSLIFSDKITKNLKPGQQVKLTQAIQLIADNGAKYLVSSNQNVVILHEALATPVPRAIGPQKNTGDVNQFRRSTH